MDAEKFSGIFDIALVLLGVLGATETTYFAQVWNDPTALKFAIMPFLFMILIWLIKELYKNALIKENRSELWLLLTETCWQIWSLTLAYYVFFFALTQMSLLPMFAILSSLLIGFIIFFAVLGAYRYEFKDEVPRYYKTLKWVIIRSVVAAIFAVISYITFIPI